MLLGSDSAELSESIIVLGKGVYNWSRRYRTRLCCVAGIAEISGFLRLYPIFAHEQVEKFDVIQVAIREDRPERHRPESKKIWPNSLRVVSREDELQEQHNILRSLCEPGQFLHAEEWRRRSLGVVSPIKPHFWATKTGKIFVHYQCSVPSCNGHLNEVRELVKVDRVGRWWKPKKEEAERFIKRLTRGKKEIYFLMGTHRNHPHRWILIAVHAFPHNRGKKEAT